MPLPGCLHRVIAWLPAWQLQRKSAPVVHLSTAACRRERMQPPGPATSAPFVDAGICTDATSITMPCPRVLCTVIVLYLQLNVWSFTFLSPYATFARCFTVTTPHATFTAASAPIRIKTKPKVAHRTHCSPLQNSQTALEPIEPPIQWFLR